MSMAENIEDPNLQTTDNQPENPIENAENKPKASTFFYIMLVLSMVNAGLNFFTNVIWGIFSPTIGEMFEDGTLPVPEELTEMIRTQLRIPYYYYFILEVFWALSFYGALSMWGLRKTGFHSYALAQLLLLLLPLVFLGKAYVQIGDIMFALLFIGYYAWVIFLRNKETSNE